MTKAPVPATRAGRCDCCSRPFPAGTLIAWDSAKSGWVLAAHARPVPRVQPTGSPATGPAQPRESAAG